jgi:hypothetical protein
MLEVANQSRRESHQLDFRLPGQQRVKCADHVRGQKVTLQIRDRRHFALEAVANTDPSRLHTKIKKACADHGIEKRRFVSADDFFGRDLMGRGYGKGQI